MSDDRGLCALWYVRYGTPDYDIYDNERNAAAAAFHMVDNNMASPMGVQFPDGRTIHREEWPALQAYERERVEKERREASQSPAPRPATRTIRDPFGGRPIEVEADEPDWLGQA